MDPRTKTTPSYSCFLLPAFGLHHGRVSGRDSSVVGTPEYPPTGRRRRFSASLPPSSSSSFSPLTSRNTPTPFPICPRLCFLGDWTAPARASGVKPLSSPLLSVVVWLLFLYTNTPPAIEQSFVSLSLVCFCDFDHDQFSLRTLLLRGACLGFLCRLVCVLYLFLLLLLFVGGGGGVFCFVLFFFFVQSIASDHERYIHVI